MSDDEFRPAQMISERLAERIRTEGSECSRHLSRGSSVNIKSLGRMKIQYS